MSTVQQAEPEGAPDIRNISRIIPLKLIREMERAKGDPDDEYVQQKISSAHAKIDAYPILTDPQKQNLKDMIRFSPDPVRTLESIYLAARRGHLVADYTRWGVGFQYFADGGRGISNSASQASAGVVAHHAMDPAMQQSPVGAARSATPRSFAATQRSAVGTPAKSTGTRRSVRTDRKGLESAQSPEAGTARPKLGTKRNATDSNLPPSKLMRMTESASMKGVETLAEYPGAARDPKFPERLKKRSGGRCELSGRQPSSGVVTEGAHIFGIATAAGERATVFWDLLDMFWDPEIVEELRNACTQNINDMSNGITMECSSHRQYDELQFYLEVVPDSYSVSGDKAQYTAKIRFPRSPSILYNHWKDTGHMSDGTPGVSLLTDGDEITFKTDDQKNCPLPDPVLLQLRGVLTKCAFLRAGGEREDEILANELRAEQIRADLRATLIDYGDYTYSDDYLNDDEEIYDPPGVIDLDTRDAVPGDTESNIRVESWLEDMEPGDGGLQDEDEADAPGQDGELDGYQGAGDE